MFPNLSFSRPRTAPSGYEKVRVPFHLIRTAQLVSSMIVGAIMLYFIWHLTHDHWATPWTFIVLAAVSLLTIAALSATIVFHFCCGLSPVLNICLNGAAFVLWGMGFGMLSWWMWGTLTHMCDLRNWNDGTGVMVCRIYKALFTFSLLGFVSTICALALDLHIFRLGQRGGRHVRLNDLDQKRRPAAVRGPYTDEDHRSLSSDEDLPRQSEAFEVPHRGYGAQPDSKQLQGQGYAVPEAQFAYDTGYHGGHAERVFGGPA
ncbi:hypothetical protein MBLNU459_g8503t1 [Dothideomycetes sp. NU459]